MLWELPRLALKHAMKKLIQGRPEQPLRERETEPKPLSTVT
jgi:hypothetical protein